MASSTSSAKEMERWKRDREQAAQRTVPVAQAAKREFSAMKPDFEQVSPATLHLVVLQKLSSTA